MSGARLRRDDGFSLVELLAVMSILLIVGGVVTSALVASFNAARVSQNRIESLNDLQRGLERVGRELRAATPLEPDPTDYDNRMSAQVIRDDERIIYTYYLTAPVDGLSELREDVERYTLDGTFLESREGIFITDITNAATGTPLFTYYAVDDDNAIVEIDCDGLDFDQCLAEHLTARQVKLTLERDLPGQQPLQVETIINIRNTRYGN